LIEVRKVVRQNKVAKQVTLGIGCLEITYILGPTGKLQEISRLNWQAQILDQDTLYISPADYRQVIKKAAAILKEKR